MLERMHLQPPRLATPSLVACKAPLNMVLGGVERASSWVGCGRSEDPIVLPVSIYRNTQVVGFLLEIAAVMLISPIN